MRIPKIISKGERVYIIEKEYPNFVLYKDMKTGVKECFKLVDLVHIEQKVKGTNKVKWEREDRQ